MPGGHPRGDGQLVGEVHARAPRACAPRTPRPAAAARARSRWASHPPAVGLGRLGPLPVAARRRGQLVDHLLGQGAQRGRLDQVLAQLAGQGEQPAGDRGRDHVDLELVGPAGHHPVRELPGGGLSEQPGRRLGRQQQRVLADQPAGVGVVGRDGRLAGREVRAAQPGRVELVQQPGAGQPAQPGAHPGAELLGGLAGERQAQHLLGQHLPGGDQPDHPGGHGLGLAGPGPGHHQRRPGRRGDHRGLLVGRRRQAERGGQQVGGELHSCLFYRGGAGRPATAHRSTATRPATSRLRDRSTTFGGRAAGPDRAAVAVRAGPRHEPGPRRLPGAAAQHPLPPGQLDPVQRRLGGFLHLPTGLLVGQVDQPGTARAAAPGRSSRPNAPSAAASW